MKKIYGVFFCVLLQACSTVGSVERPSSYYQEQASNSQNSLVGDPVLGNNNDRIQELLNYQVRLPEKNRIAVLKLSQDKYWRAYSNDFTVLNDSLVKSLITKLRSSDRVYDASFLPAMLVSEKRSVSTLREAAARFQADLLLAYTSSCYSYQKYKFIDPNNSKSYCSVESILLDIRSGVIVKSIVSTEDFIASKASTDTNFRETMKRAELEAVAAALGNVASEVTSFLNGVPRI
ncbi:MULTISPECIES: hypothetical protein [Pseudoalteromonas]|uniref:ABC-type transport auxiliary lipoprotein component domain-containing protein n=1 Tax=Pseudoalteromonas rubra TaxID=43658 RepID=A0A5S3URK5_9GAMM|nr:MULTISPECIES: hypothetical protein [Pseudoalteromonas]MCG7560812.1 hypothetical protein [Pseudoalteromonas sp. McH1-42]MEC4090531.1 hypothetical protein [Pseudoalteromonas rubra]QPB82455.1 hypothetical protein CWC22_005430 [Pseudoalteromonas rubra]